MKYCCNCVNYTIASELLNAGICKLCRYVVSGSGYCPEWEGKVLKDILITLLAIIIVARHLHRTKRGKHD